MANRKAITRSQAVRYRNASKSQKAAILDSVCAVTGYHRDYARRALRGALAPKVVKPRSTREPRYGPEVVAALQKCWAVLNAPAGKRLAPILGELVPLLRGYGELDIDDATAVALTSMSAATIDRRLAVAKARLRIKGRSHTKPGSLLKSRIPMRTWADHDENTPGFVEIDLVGHEGGNPRGEFCFTLTVTDIATGWTENRTVVNKAQKWVFAALADVVEHLPFPIRGIDSDNGSEFINAHLLGYCAEHDLKFTRSRSGNKNDGAHVEQKNWTAVRQLVGYLRYDTGAELLLLNKIWQQQALIANHFYPQQKLISKVRHGAKVAKRYDTAATPYARVIAHPDVTAMPKRRLTKQHASFNPAAVQRRIQALCDQLLTLATAKNQPAIKPRVDAAHADISGEATNQLSRTS
ncbi:MAG: integrase catalytic domain-containing protein [Mycobacterium sp.]